jgi:hypothetical protein
MPELSRGDDCEQVRSQLGVYVLGAIGPAERAQVDDHLAVCPWCREQLAGLAGLPGLLRRVPLDEALQAGTDDASGPPPGPPLDRLIDRVSRIRLRRRLTAAIAAVVIALAAALTVQVLHTWPASTTAVTAPHWSSVIAGASAATGASAAVRYAAQPWGTELEVRVSGIRAGTRCQVGVINAQGQDIDAGGWIIAGSEYTWYPGSAPWPTDKLRGFVITAGGHTLITIPDR